LINDSNYENGWLFMVEPVKLKKNLKDLLFEEDAGKYMMAEKDRLVAEAGHEMRLAADGAIMMDDIGTELKGKEWSAIVRKFLRS
jgi:hypothetical protein